MADPTPDSTPNTPEQPHQPDGWELACSGILRSEFGRRRTQALEKAMSQLSAEQAWVEDRVEAARVGWWRRMQDAFFAMPIGRVAFGLAMMAAIAAAVWVLYPSHYQPGAIDLATAGCRIADTLNARWSGAAAPLKSGAILPPGQLRLESGVVELAFASGVRAAVEGPAELNVTGRNTVELSHGKISADVPKNAIGFTVKTPQATFIDLGTRFGVDVKAKDSSSEVDVFEGKVRVIQGRDTNAPDNDWNLTQKMAMVLDRRGGVTEVAAPETAFPQPARTVTIPPADRGFESVDLAKLGGFPSDAGFWSGPAYELTGPVLEVRPAQGGGMLQFFSPPRQGATAVDSVVWQVVDMRGANDFITANGTVDLKAWGAFNRVAGDSYSASKFRISIAAFRGQPSDAAKLWAKRGETALAFGEKEITTDDNPGTWEKVEAATQISATADFAVVEVRVIAPKDVPPGVNPFPGHFADGIDAKVCLSLRPSRVNVANK